MVRATNSYAARLKAACARCAGVRCARTDDTGDVTESASDDLVDVSDVTCSSSSPNVRKACVHCAPSSHRRISPLSPPSRRQHDYSA
jgi:hypothetical protein